MPGAAKFTVVIPRKAGIHRARCHHGLALAREPEHCLVFGCGVEVGRKGISRPVGCRGSALFPHAAGKSRPVSDIRHSSAGCPQFGQSCRWPTGWHRAAMRRSPVTQQQMALNGSLPGSIGQYPTLSRHSAYQIAVIDDRGSVDIAAQLFKRLALMRTSTSSRDLSPVTGHCFLGVTCILCAVSFPSSAAAALRNTTAPGTKCERCAGTCEYIAAFSGTTIFWAPPS